MTVPILKVFDLSIVDGQVYWFGYAKKIVLFYLFLTSLSLKGKQSINL